MKVNVASRLAVFLALPALTFAQDLAPASLAGKSAVVVISSSTGIFPSVGGYRFVFLSSGDNYRVSPLSSTVVSRAGTYSYSKTGPATATIVRSDPHWGTTLTQSLVFTSASTAAYSISTDAGAQTGTFVLENSAAADSSDGLINMAVRAQVPAGGQIIPGFVLDSPTRVLIRVAGPALAAFGVTGTLPNPKLTLMSGNRTILNNDDWAGSAANYDAVRSAAERTGAFAFNFGSKDAAVVVDLASGNYTAIVTGEAGTSGEMLLEVYRVPRR